MKSGFILWDVVKEFVQAVEVCVLISIVTCIIPAPSLRNNDPHLCANFK